jgi:hypothetical protein
VSASSVVERFERQILGEMSYFATKRSRDSYSFHLNAKVATISWKSLVLFQVTFGRPDYFCVTQREFRRKILVLMGDQIIEADFDKRVNARVKDADRAQEMIAEQMGFLENDVKDAQRYLHVPTK